MLKGQSSNNTTQLLHCLSVWLPTRLASLVMSWLNRKRIQATYLQQGRALSSQVPLDPSWRFLERVGQEPICNAQLPESESATELAPSWGTRRASFFTSFFVRVCYLPVPSVLFLRGPSPESIESLFFDAFQHRKGDQSHSAIYR